MSSSSSELCIKCNMGGEVLVCKGEGCITVVHNNCLGVPVSFDDAGGFQCPYCVTRKAYEEYERAKEDVDLKEKALCVFMAQVKAAHEERKKMSQTVNVETANQEADNFEFHVDVPENANTKGSPPPPEPEVPRPGVTKISYPVGARRVFWTPEEEAQIRFGVTKSAARRQKNIPWKKILKVGRKVFHQSREPSHLKDKWRKMQVKDKLAK